MKLKKRYIYLLAIVASIFLLSGCSDEEEKKKKESTSSTSSSDGSGTEGDSGTASDSGATSDSGAGATICSGSYRSGSATLTISSSASSCTYDVGGQTCSINSKDGDGNVSGLTIAGAGGSVSYAVSFSNSCNTLTITNGGSINFTK